MPIEGLRHLYGLVSNPDTKDMKLKSFESLIFGTFLYKNSLKITITDINSYAKNNGLKNPSQLILSKVIEKLTESGVIKKDDDKTIALAEKESFSRFSKQLNENQEKMKKFYDFMISKMQNHFEEVFSQEINDGLKRLISYVIEEVMENYSDSVIAFYNGELKSTYRENIDILIKKNVPLIKELKYQDGDFLIDVQISLLKIFKNQFLGPDIKFANGLRLYAVKYIMSKIVIKNPSMDAIKKNFFKDAKIFIDTNILIFLLCKSSRLFDVTNNLLFETEKLGGSILISHWTLNEFNHSVDNAKYLYKKIREGKIKLHKVDSDILNSYYESPQHSRDWFKFITELKNNLNSFIETGFITLVNCDEPEKLKLENVENILTAEFSKIKFDKKSSLISHDAKMILHIQDSRVFKELTIGTCWFLTADERLRKIERKNLSKLNFRSEGLISCDIWFELLIPFVETEYDEEEISKSFSKLLGINLLPISQDLVESYIKNLSIQLDLIDNDVDLIKKRIENVHVRNAIESAIIDEDYIGANTVIKDMLEDTKEKDDLRKTIHELSARLRAFGIPGHTTFIKMEKLILLKEKVIDANTSNEKGKTLEDIVEYLFDSINGIDLIERDKRLEAEEIDLIFRNAAFISWKDPIIVECKNWSKPIGTPEVVNFIEKVKVMGACTGILVTYNGVTGNEFRDAMSKIKNALKDKIHILVVNWDDIEGIKSDEDWIDLLTRKFYLPTK